MLAAEASEAAANAAAQAALSEEAVSDAYHKKTLAEEIAKAKEAARESIQAELRGFKEGMKLKKQFLLDREEDMDDYEYEDISPLSPEDMIKANYSQWEGECEALLEDTDDLDI